MAEKNDNCLEILICLGLIGIIIAMLIIYKDTFVKERFLVMPPNTNNEFGNDIVMMTDENENPYYVGEAAYNKVGADDIYNVPEGIDRAAFYDTYKHTIECDKPDCIKNRDVFAFMEDTRIAHRNNACATCDRDIIRDEIDKQSKNIAEQNLEKFSTLRSSLYQYSNDGETAIDRINNVRCGEDNYGNYGNATWDVYDNMLKK